MYKRQIIGEPGTGIVTGSKLVWSLESLTVLRQGRPVVATQMLTFAKHSRIVTATVADCGFERQSVSEAVGVPANSATHTSATS